MAQPYGQQAPLAAANKKRSRFPQALPDALLQAHATSSVIPSIVNPPSPQLVPRHSSSASSWGIEDLSDSDGDYDWHSASLPPNVAPQPWPAHSNLDEETHHDELASLARPAKRPHLESHEDRQTFGKLAGLHIHSSPVPPHIPTASHQYGFGDRPLAPRANTGLTAAFGLASAVPSSRPLDPLVAAHIAAPRVPPSSPTKLPSAPLVPAALDMHASAVYQHAIAPAPPTSPSLSQSAPTFAQSHNHPMHQHHNASLDADADAEMSMSRRVPSSFEVEPNRIVVTSLDDSCSSDDDDDDGGGDDGPASDRDAAHRTAPVAKPSDFVINNELIEKLEAHSRAVITGTSHRDNAASTSRSGAAAATGAAAAAALPVRSRRSGRRSAGTPAISGLGSVLSSRRRSNQSSPASSGYATPINADDARGALILWKDPEQVLKAATTTAGASSAGAHTAADASAPARTGFLGQAPVAFQSGPACVGQAGAPVGMPSPPHTLESPLYAQQSRLSSSYFPEPSVLEARFGGSIAAPPLQGFGTGGSAPGFVASAAFAGAPAEPHYGERHYGHHYGLPEPAHSNLAPHMHVFSAASSRTNAAGAQPVDLSGCLGASEEMELDS